MRKPDFCTCENKDADQLRGNREADQRLCFRHTDSTIPLLPKPKISSFKLYPAIAQPGTWSETPKTGFLTTRLISDLDQLSCRNTMHTIHLQALTLRFKHFFHAQLIIKFELMNIKTVSISKEFLCSNHLSC